MDTHLRERPRTRTTGSGRAVTTSSPAAASWTSRFRPRRRPRLQRVAASLPRRPHLLAPAGDRLVVPLDGASGRDLAGPFVADQQLAYALDGAGQVEASADQRLDPDQRPPLVLPVMRGRPLGQFRLQLRDLLVAQSR